MVPEDISEDLENGDFFYDENGYDLKKDPPLQSTKFKKVKVNFILEARNKQTDLTHFYKGEIRTTIS